MGGAAANESTPNRLGKSTCTLIVVPFSSSVGSATLNSWLWCLTIVGGLTLAWPNAEAGSAIAPATTSAPAARQVMLAMTDSCWAAEAAGRPRDRVSAGGGGPARVTRAARDGEHRQRRA